MHEETEGTATLFGELTYNLEERALKAFFWLENSY